VNESTTFYPPRQAGFVFHGAAILVLLAASAWGLFQAIETDVGLFFLFYMLPALISLGLVPLLAYRLIALRNAHYVLQRDGIHLVWGLRVEDIPMNEIDWARPHQELNPRPPRPWLHWPGAMIGIRRSADGGKVEYLAASARRSIVIHTPDCSMVISPADPAAFLQALQSYMEMGSLAPMPARSVYPSFFIARVWRAQPVRYLLLAGLLLNLALLTWVLLAIPPRTEVTLGFGPGREPVPAVQLLLLPIISGFFFLLDAFLGLYLFRRAEGRVAQAQSSSHTEHFPGLILSYLLWGSGVLVAVLFLAVLFFIL